MKKIILALFVLFLLFLSQGAVLAQEQIEVNFFYGEGCPNCAQIKPVVENIAEKYPGVKFNIYEIYFNSDNNKLFHQYTEMHEIPFDQRGVPTVFIGDEYYVGGQIINNLENKILEMIESGEYGNGDLDDFVFDLNSLSWAVVIGAALVDSINPCAIAVLLILMGALLAAGNRKRALRAGLAFTLSIYTSYFLFGLGLFNIIQISGLSFLFYRFVGLIAIIVGIFNIKDYFSYGAGGFVMEIPRRWRPTIKKILGGITSPVGAFLAGFVVCLFELPCTGGPYLFILGLLAEKTTQMAAIPILMIYNLFFVAPLLIMIALLYCGTSTTESANQWKDRNIKKLHLIAGIVMVLLGMIVFLGLI